jgi:hypothetical protein
VCLDRDPDAWLLVRICGDGVISSSVSMNLDISGCLHVQSMIYLGSIGDS